MKRFFSLLMLLFAFAVPMMPAWSAPHGPLRMLHQRPLWVPNEWVIKFVHSAPLNARAQLHTQAGALVLRRMPGLDLETVHVPSEAALAAYRGSPNVVWLEPNARRYPLLADPNDIAYNALDTDAPNDPADATWYKWDAHLIQCVDGWNLWPGKYYSYPGVPKSSPGVRIAIIDSGIDYAHPDFVNAGASSSDSAAGGQLDKSLDVSILNGVQTPLANDEFGHGTHVTGIAAAATNNGGGVTGNGYNATVLSLKVIDSTGNGSESDIVAAIVYAADHGALIENLSLGGYAYSKAEQDAINYAWNKGTLIVAAAGNDGTDTQPVYPGALSRVLTVSATGASDTLAAYSDYGDQVGIAAPGGDFDYDILSYIDVYSTMPTYYVTLNDPSVYGATETYSYLEGTSMACPQVAGLAALYAGMKGYTQGPGIPLKLWQAIQQGADNIGGNGWEPYFGYGRINVYGTLNLAAAPNPRGDTVGCITGVVLYKGTPVANAALSAVPVGGGTAQTANSRSDGGYRIINAPAGAYTLTATVFGESQTINTIPVTAGCDIPAVDFNVGMVTVSLTALSFSPSGLAGGGTTTGKVTLSAPAPSSGAKVTLTSSNPSVLAVPSSVTISAGSSVQTFTATSSAVTATALVTITATYNGLSKTSKVTVSPVALSAISASPSTLVGGSGSATGTVTLTGAATTTATVTLTSSNPAALPVRASVTITPGHRTANFTATSAAVTASTTVTITASCNGLSKTTTVTVNPPALASVSASPSTLVGGSGSATGTVTLTGAATTTATVTLTSSNPAALPVRASVTITPGHRTANFTATSAAVTASTTVTITASCNGLSKTTTVTVTP